MRACLIQVRVRILMLIPDSTPACICVHKPSGDLYHAVKRVPVLVCGWLPLILLTSSSILQNGRTERECTIFSLPSLQTRLQRRTSLKLRSGRTSSKQVREHSTDHTSQRGNFKLASSGTKSLLQVVFRT